MPALADSVARLGTESAFAVLARARELERAGRDIVHLEIGEPGFDTPPHIVEAAVAALHDGQTRYCPAAGLSELRSAAAAYLGPPRELQLDPEHVVIANGAKPLLLFTILAVVNPGDEVIYPDPGFPIYESAIAWAGGRPVPLPLRAERGFSPDPAELAGLLTPRTRLVILNSPHNPTGSVIGDADLAAIGDVLAATDTWVLSDEVYAKQLYDGSFSSVASLPGMVERTVILDSCSKTFGMTGWRCGFAAVPPALVDPLVLMLINSTSCVPPFVQLGALAALTGPMSSLESNLAALRERRDRVVAGLNAIEGISCHRPDGAFYAFPDVSATGADAEQLARELLEVAGVALLSGSGFGAHATDHLRISYGTSLEALDEGLARIRAFLAARAR